MTEEQVALSFLTRSEEGRGSRTGAAPSEVSALPAAELLARVMGHPHKDVVREAFASYGNLRRLASVHPAELREQGLTPAAIEKLGYVLELARRFGEEEFVAGAPFRGSADVYAHFRERLAVETVEYFIAVLLDNKHRKLRDVVVSMGSLTSSIVHPRDVFARIIRDAAAAVIFVHNHPSGDPTPSREDLEITRRLREVGDLIGVRVLDHVIIGQGRYVSFVDDGFW